MLVKTLQAAGLRRDDVQVIPLTWDRHEAAWQRGEVDVVITFRRYPAACSLAERSACSTAASCRIPSSMYWQCASRCSNKSAMRSVI